MPSPETPPPITAELLEAMRRIARCTQAEWDPIPPGAYGYGPYEAAARVLAFCDAMLSIVPHDTDPR